MAAVIIGVYPHKGSCHTAVAISAAEVLLGGDTVYIGSDDHEVHALNAGS
jgi:PQQ-like domain